MTLTIYNIKRHADERGSFSETFNQKMFPDTPFVQDMRSFSSKKGTIRGLHFQVPPFGQSKLVWCSRGEVLDVIVDIRRGSPTYGKHFKIKLSSENNLQIHIPIGFAHGFITMLPETEMCYKVSNYHAPDCEAGIKWNDPDLNIEWPDIKDNFTISERDSNLTDFINFNSPFDYDGIPLSTTHIFS